MFYVSQKFKYKHLKLYLGLSSGGRGAVNSLDGVTGRNRNQVRLLSHISLIGNVCTAILCFSLAQIEGGNLILRRQLKI